MGNIGAGRGPDNGSGATPPRGFVGSAPGGDDAIGVEKATFWAFLDISGSYEAELYDYLARSPQWRLAEGSCCQLFGMIPNVQCVKLKKIPVALYIGVKPRHCRIKQARSLEWYQNFLAARNGFGIQMH